MSEVKKIARAEIEFEAQGLEDGRIEFELEGEKWVARPEKLTHAHTIKPYVSIIKDVRDELGCSLGFALDLVKAVILGK